MSDPLAPWWRHEVVLERLLGSGPYGDKWADPETVHGAVDDRRRLVRDGTGSEVVSETTVLLSIVTADVPLGSRVTLPATFGERTSTVLSAARHDSGGLPTPDHLELALL
ncbi:hypothetical protein [Enterococcus hirae]|uniref:hypothetical protein n=1 Tax=Enterococcus hirae TaxID=1354 RepID=UPI00136F887B|nr:hypothetical protein [Enterococcus hirae]NAE18077.1 hypothetical protein [Enterococcus hirae]